VLPTHSADPWIIFHGGFYYYSESRHRHQILIRRSRSIAGISLDPGTCVWTAPSHGLNSDNLWAPELHLIDGKWFIYYAADDGHDDNRRIWVLECESSDPRGAYRCRGKLNTGGWATEATILALDDGRKYFIWSGWPGRRNSQQNIYVAGMRDPVTLLTPRVLIAEPDQAWERVAMPICESPQVLKRNDHIFVVYSASGSWTPDYCLGLLHNKTRDVLNPDAWVKHGPVFRRTEQVWNVGHCSFAKSLCQSEDWLIYRSKSNRLPDWEHRDVQAAPFTWTSDGFPEFDLPLPPARKSPLPEFFHSPALQILQPRTPA
jgi:GH43 family beta-xylosidase